MAKKFFWRSKRAPPTEPGSGKKLFFSGSLFGSVAQKKFLRSEIPSAKKLFFSLTAARPAESRGALESSRAAIAELETFSASEKNPIEKVFFPCGFLSLRIRSSRIFLRSGNSVRKKFFSGSNYRAPGGLRRSSRILSRGHR